MGDRNKYKYYLLANTPVRVTFNAQGLKLGAEAPDLETGELVLRMDLLSRVEVSPDVKEVGADEFQRACEALVSKKNNFSRPAFLN